MHLVTYSIMGNCRLGALIGDDIVDLRAAYVAAGLGDARFAETLFPSDMTAFLSSGPVGMDAARAAVEYGRRSDAAGEVASGCPVRFPRTSVRLEAPVPRPGMVICIGLNYRDHAEETGSPIPKEPIIFTKFPSNVIGPEDDVIHPGEHLTSKLDYEVELVVVMGKEGKNIPEDDALSYVAGYTVGNDISARDLQLERDGQWTKGKALDTFAPMGPALVTADEVPDPHKLPLGLRLNGTTMQDSNTEQLIFSVPHVIAFLSRLFTLHPGDVIFTGTPPGVGMARKPPVWLKPGDVMEAYIEGLGTLTNKVVAADGV